MGKKVIIVGGVAAGASTAARLRRLEEDTEIVLFERGQDISFANCGLPYYVGGIIAKKNWLLVQTPKGMRRRFHIDVRVLTEVQQIIPEEKQVVAHDLASGEIYRESYDALVLCPGAQPVIPDIAGIHAANVFTVRNIPDSERIKAHIETCSPKHAIVVGAGYIGLVIAEMLHARGVKVTLVEAGDQILHVLDPDMAAVVENRVIKQGISIIKSDHPVSMEGEPYVEKVTLASGESLPANMVMLGLGVRPETWLAEQAGLALGETGGILVNAHLQTSNPHIYAAGDAVQLKDIITGQDTLVPLAGPANRQGWIVANNIAGRDVTYRGSQGTSIVKVLDMTVAVTGQNERSLKRLGWDYLACHAHPYSHATYYPGSTQMTIKLLFAPGDGKVLGAQVVGYDNVDKTVDVLATAIRAGMSVVDLQDLELAYAPPYSSAKNPVNVIGYTAGNVLDGLVETMLWSEALERAAAGAILVDVRTADEFERGQVPGAINLPMDEIRDRMEELPRDKEILTYCQVGLRSYVANRLLMQKGYHVKNISGGYKLYHDGLLEP